MNDIDTLESLANEEPEHCSINIVDENNNGFVIDQGLSIDIIGEPSKARYAFALLFPAENNTVNMELIARLQGVEDTDSQEYHISGQETNEHSTYIIKLHAHGKPTQLGSLINAIIAFGGLNFFDGTVRVRYHSNMSTISDYIEFPEDKGNS